MVQNDIIAAEARKWLGVAFRHQGRSRHGVDCLGLLVVVANALNLHDFQGKPLANYDQQSYGHYPDEKRLLAGLLKVLTPTLTLASGNIGLFEIDGTARHVGIFATNESGFTLIHAYAPARNVVEHHYSREWQQRCRAMFRLI